MRAAKKTVSTSRIHLSVPSSDFLIATDKTNGTDCAHVEKSFSTGITAPFYPRLAHCSLWMTRGGELEGELVPSTTSAVQFGILLPLIPLVLPSQVVTPVFALVLADCKTGASPPDAPLQSGRQQQFFLLSFFPHFKSI